MKIRRRSSWGTVFIARSWNPDSSWKTSRKQYIMKSRKYIRSRLCRKENRKSLKRRKNEGKFWKMRTLWKKKKPDPKGGKQTGNQKQGRPCCRGWPAAALPSFSWALFLPPA